MGVLSAVSARCACAATLALYLLAPDTAHGAKIVTLHTFQGGSDGANPSSSLTNVHGTLYGVTPNGGANGVGTVYTVTPQGVETVLYSFKSSGGDAQRPESRLLELKGLLYGTSPSGGAGGYGTVFAVTPAGAETVVYSFTNGHDGSVPESGLISVGDMLYGTAGGGGAGCCGTVFSLTRNGHLKTLHSFNNDPDGAYPDSSGPALIYANGVLYGTTMLGGINGGTFYAITPQGAETVLHSFQHGSDGWLPKAGLVALNGTIYGATSEGGGCGNGNEVGCGTVFGVTQGTLSVLHAFVGRDGDAPLGGLLVHHTELYGVTARGGRKETYGTVYKITPAGLEQTVHRFAPGGGGYSPVSDLVDLGGVLYGTTELGGGACNCGTVFKLVR